MSTSKAILKSVDLSEELMQETVECAAQVLLIFGSDAITAMQSPQ